MNEKINIPLVDLKANYYSIKPEIDETIADVLEHSAFIMGEHVKKFDKNWADYCQVKYAFGVSNGTEALRLALKAIGITKNDEIITVSNTFIATTESISDNGGIIKFVDINEDTYTIDITKIETQITSKTKAIVCVHLYGHPCDMDQIIKLAKKYNLKIIEDCAQAHGAKYKGQMVGSIGDIGTWSMFPAKILGSFGDAGAITTNNDSLAEKIKLLRDHGRTSKYWSVTEGYNARIDGLQAAILNVKMKYLDTWIIKRREIAKKYTKELKGVITPIEKPEAFHPYYMYVIRTTKREELMKYLESKGIHTGIHYPYPLHIQDAYKHLNLKEGSFPITEKVAKEILSIPIYPEMTEEQITKVIEEINKFVASNDT